MASLLTDPLYEISGVGPSPNKNFYYFAVRKSEVIWRWWKISPRTVDRYSKPGERSESHQDFLDDPWLNSEVRMVFGQKIWQYAKALCQGHYDYLERLSDSLLLRIINYLELEDVGQLGRTSRRFRQLCGSEGFWEIAVRQRCKTVSSDVSSLALEVGWRHIFFTNKLQLQKQINRWKLKKKEQMEEQVWDPDRKAEECPDGTPEMRDESDEESHPDVNPDIYPDPNTDAECAAGCNVPEHLLEDLKNCEVTTAVQSRVCPAAPQNTLI